MKISNFVLLYFRLVFRIFIRHIDRAHVNPLPKKKKSDVPKTPRICEFCSQSFKSIHNLKSHMQTVHEGPKNHKCQLCEKAFRYFTNLKSHMKQCHNISCKFQCKYCNVGMVFQNRGALYDHIYDLHDKYPCKSCKNSFTNIELLKDHEKSVHEGICELCNEKFTTQRLLQLHMRILHKEKPCESCGEIFFHLAALKKHRKDIHGIDFTDEHKKHEFICEECGKVYENNTKLSYHKMVKHSEPELKCDQCSKKCFTQHGINKHIKDVHEKKACTMCGEMFSDKGMKAHMYRKHTEDHLKPHVCKICGKGFDEPHRFNTHMNIHLGKKPHKCKYCDRAFADKANAFAHIKSVHEGFKRPSKSKINDVSHNNELL